MLDEMFQQNAIFLEKKPIVTQWTLQSTQPLTSKTVTCPLLSVVVVRYIYLYNSSTYNSFREKLMTFLKRKFKDLQNEPPYDYSKFNSAIFSTVKTQKSSIKKPRSLGNGTGCLYRRSAPMIIMIRKV